MQTATSFETHEQASAQGASAQLHADVLTRGRNHPVRFTEWDRQDQLQAFFAWLPSDLHDAPGIEWAQLPPAVMGYCVRTIGASPDAAHLAIAVASALGAMNTRTLLALTGHLSKLLRVLRETCQLHHLSDLHAEQLWQDFLSKTNLMKNRRAWVLAYSSVSTGHFPRYLQRLDAVDRSRMQTYAFPPLPADFLRKYFPYSSVKQAQQAKRKAQSDVLVPLYPVLRQLVRFRKQLAERTLLAIHEARRKVEAGEASLPFSFSHTDNIPEVNRDARTVSAVQISGREVTMPFILWDKRTWVHHHKGNFSHDVINEAKAGRGAYIQEQNSLFVQYDGPPGDLLWFGNLIEYRLLQQFQVADSQDPGYRERWQFARSLGFTNGCYCYRPGLLNSSDKWLAESARPGELLFEPESLYRGVLFGATLAMIALSNGSRESRITAGQLEQGTTYHADRNRPAARRRWATTYGSR